MENQSVFVKKNRTILIHKFILKIISPVNLFIIPGQHCTLILDNLTDISHDSFKLSDVRLSWC